MDHRPPSDHQRDEYSVSEAVPRSESTEESQDNPRKRKKSSRACDFCHANHQPCDNAKPRCSYCQRHGKTCLYLRPQKKRGPAQGYRSALHTMRESAAAWGAALTLIPSLGPVVEGYLKQPEGRRLVKAIHDPQQQEFFIQAWQQSAVFKNFFGDDSELDTADDATLRDRAPSAGLSIDDRIVQAPQAQTPLQTVRPVQAQAPPLPAPSPALLQTPIPAAISAGIPAPSQAPIPPPQTTRPGGRPTPTMLPLGHAPDPTTEQAYSHPPPMFPMPPAPYIHDTSLMKPEPKLDHRPPNHGQSGSLVPHTTADMQPHTTADMQPRTTADMQPHTIAVEFSGAMSLSDIVARDAARSSTSFSQTLGSLGFAPNETLNDFLAISYNPDPMGNNMAEADLSLGSEMDQKAYYELLMGRQFT